MTDPVAKTSILATLLADLKSIEENFHGLADPQLAIGGKMREILTEAVAVIDSVDFRAAGAKIDAGLKAIEEAAGKSPALNGVLETIRTELAKALAMGEQLQQVVSTIESHSKDLSSLSSAISLLTSRVATLEQPTPAQAAPTQPAAEGGAAQAGANASGVGTTS